MLKYLDLSALPNPNSQKQANKCEICFTLDIPTVVLFLRLQTSSQIVDNLSKPGLRIFQSDYLYTIVNIMDVFAYSPWMFSRIARNPYIFQIQSGSYYVP